MRQIKSLKFSSDLLDVVLEEVTTVANLNEKLSVELTEVCALVEEAQTKLTKIHNKGEYDGL